MLFERYNDNKNDDNDDDNLDNIACIHTAYNKGEHK